MESAWLGSKLDSVGLVLSGFAASCPLTAFAGRGADAVE